jgi:hypothetical protein
MRLITALLAVMLLTFGCNDDENLTIIPANEIPSYGDLDKRTAKQMEVALSRALTNPVFLKALRIEFLKFKTGDTETLISEVIGSKGSDSTQKNDADARAIFLEYLAPDVTSADLDAFISSNPNYIFGLRGNFATFYNDQTLSAAYVMPDNFSDGITNVDASVNGEPTNLNLEEKLEVAVVVLQKSERHTADGSYFLDVHPGGYIRGGTVGTIDAGGGIDNPQSQPPAVTECPAGVNAQILTSFTAAEVNGSILLRYEIDQSNTAPLTINVFRLGPGESSFSLISQRTEDDDRIFYDTDLAEGLNVEYQYRLEALISTPGDDGELIECDAENANGDTELYAMATATTTFTRVASFTGRNTSSTTISYTWVAPEDTPVNEYRLSVFENNNLTEVAIINTSADQLHQFTYNYPENKKGELVEMQIQYRAAGNTWVGDFYDRTYGSFRDGDEPYIYTTAYA